MNKPNIVTIDLEDIQPEEQAPTKKQQELYNTIGQVVVPIGYRKCDARLGTEESIGSVVLINHLWLPAAAHAVGDARLDVQLVDIAIAVQINMAI